MLYGIAVVFIVLLFGGAAAWLTSEFARNVARQKISFFGLRPRHTSVLITVVSGIFVSLAILAIIAFSSEKARHALLALNRLETRSAEMKQELFRRNSLRPTAALFTLGDPVSMKYVRSELLAAEKEQAVYALLDSAQAELHGRNADAALFLDPVFKTSDKPAVSYDRERLFALIDGLSRIKSDVVVVACAESTVMMGKNLPLYFTAVPRRIVYRQGERIAEFSVDGTLQEDLVLLQIYEFLHELETKAAADGMMKVPASRRLTALSYGQITSLTARVMEANRPLKLAAYAPSNIYNHDSLTVTVKLEK